MLDAGGSDVLASCFASHAGIALRLVRPTRNIEKRNRRACVFVLSTKPGAVQLILGAAAVAAHLDDPRVESSDDVDQISLMRHNIDEHHYDVICLSETWMKSATPNRLIPVPS